MNTVTLINDVDVPDVLSPEAVVELARGARVFSLDTMSTAERSLLVYFEICYVDHEGRVDHKEMDRADFIIAKRWAEAGLVKFGKIKFKDHNEDGNHWVEMTEAAMLLAHQERRVMAERGRSRRRYRRTKEEA